MMAGGAGVFALAGSAICPCCTQLAQAAEGGGGSAPQKGGSGYTYKGQTGPVSWPGMSNFTLHTSQYFTFSN